MYTKHAYSLVVLASWQKALHNNAFVPTRPVNTGARHTVPVSTARGASFWNLDGPWTWPVNTD